MKKIIFTQLLSISCFLLQAQSAVEKIELKGTVYTVTKQIPDDLKPILGKYTYEWGKNGEEPIVQLNPDGTGFFQPHQVAPVPMEFWFDCDESGVVRKQQGDSGRFRITLLVKYGESANGNYPTGKYDLMCVTVVTDENYAVIYGERFKKLKGD
jgi:hypothetical protein